MSRLAGGRLRPGKSQSRELAHNRRGPSAVLYWANMRAPRSTCVLFLTLALMSIPVAGSQTGDSVSERTPLEGPPPVNSPWRTLEVSADPDHVRTELLSLFKAEGLTVVEEKRSEAILRTDLIPFDAKKFAATVATPPPKASAEYPYYQTNAMRVGRFGLESHVVRRGPGRTRLDLRALLEIQALSKNQGVMLWVPRISNGAIENIYLSRLASRFEPQSAPSSLPPR